MIRQAISCDICGAEKKQTNHWFVAYIQAGELRVSGWSAQRRLRAGSKHLCGQTCLHKLVDEFIAGNVTSRVQSAVPDVIEANQPVPATDASLTSRAAYAGRPSLAESSAGSILSPLVTPATPAAVIAIASSRITEPCKPPADITPNYASRHWRAEAWERERERCSGIGAHRKTL
jgi:hypothetical protein